MLRSTRRRALLVPLLAGALGVPLAGPADAVPDPQPDPRPDTTAGSTHASAVAVESTADATDDATAQGQALEESLTGATATGRSTAAALVATARSQLGVVETGSNCTPYGPCAAWCHYFAAWAGRTSGNGSITPQTGYTPSGVSFFLSRGAYSGGSPFAAPARWAFAPRPGDYVYFWRSYLGRVGHVGIVTGVDTATRTITTIEGNSSNAVRARTHRYGPGTGVHGFGRPAYADAAPVDPPADPSAVGAFPLRHEQAYGYDPRDVAGDTLIHGTESAAHREAVVQIQRRHGGGS